MVIDLIIPSRISVAEIQVPCLIAILRSLIDTIRSRNRRPVIV